jgi:hypothetical protein
MIDTREGLIDALHEAAELEHGLLLQYLFAAVSLKKRDDEGLTPAEQELARTWEARVLAVAREEMAHLGTVFNLLTAVGGAPRLERPNFPQPAKTYYPFAFSLTRYSDEAVYRFIRAELPKGEKPPAPPVPLRQEAFLSSIDPEPIEYHYIGELYRQIRDAFSKLPEETLFIGPRHAQDVENWSRRMQILRVVDRASADAAIDFVVIEGEGAPGNRKGSHYDTFLDLRAQLAEANCDPARAVVPNPRTRPHRESAYPATLLENSQTIEVAQVLNQIYQVTLLMLGQLYGYGGESFGERSALRSAARQIMTMGVRPLAEILTMLPAGKDPKGPVAGPTFELHDGLQLSTQAEGRWTILLERLDLIVKSATALVGLNPRIAFVAENIGLIAGNLRRARAAEERL